MTLVILNSTSLLNNQFRQPKSGRPVWVAVASVQWWILCDRVHSSWCWRRTATSPSSFCALFPACPCNRMARAGFLLQLLRDKSDTCPRHCRAAEEKKTGENGDETNDNVRAVGWFRSHASSSPSHLCKLTALTTVESGRPSFAVTLAMYWACVVESDSSESLEASDSALPE